MKGNTWKAESHKAIETKYPPIAISWADEKPEGTMQFQEGKWGCVMWLAASAAKGRPAACDAATFGCIGGGVGMGFGDRYKSFPEARRDSATSSPPASRDGRKGPP